MGDFHVILNACDKKGGRGYDDTISVRAFRNFFFGLGLLDTGFAGPRFTWCNNRPVQARILVRLDRVFANPRFLHPNFISLVQHPTMHLFFCRIILGLNGSRVSLNLSTSGEAEKGNSSWNWNLHRKDAGHMEIFASKLLNLKHTLLNWNRTEMGSLKARLRRVQADIDKL